jgi:hypothetical protein
VLDLTAELPAAGTASNLIFSRDKHTVGCAIHSRVISASTPKLRRRVIDDLEGDSAPMNEKSSPEELIKYRRYALKEVLSFPAILIRQRRTAITVQIASTTPNGQAPCRKP